MLLYSNLLVSLLSLNKRVQGIEMGLSKANSWGGSGDDGTREKLQDSSSSSSSSCWSFRWQRGPYSLSSSWVGVGGEGVKGGWVGSKVTTELLEGLR